MQNEASAKEPDADAAAALAAPTQTMEAAGILDGSPDKVVNAQSDMSDNDDEETCAEPAGKAKGKGKAMATASSVPRRTSSRVKGKAPEPEPGPPDVPDGGEAAASGEA